MNTIIKVVRRKKEVDRIVVKYKLLPYVSRNTHNKALIVRVV